MKHYNLVLCALVVGTQFVHAQTKIVAVKGDITKQKVDAIVNAANPELAAGGGVCGAIFKAAGKPELQAACRRYPVIKGARCPVGGACITDSFNLKKIGVKKIIHAVGPDARKIKDTDKQRALLESAYTKSLELATSHGLTSIAFPFISSGIYKVDHQLASKAAVTAARNYVKKHKTSLKEIRFVLWSDKEYQLFKKRLSSK